MPPLLKLAALVTAYPAAVSLRATSPADAPQAGNAGIPV
jgi:hypothetical protein